MRFRDSSIHSIEQLCFLEKLEYLILKDNAFTRIPCFKEFENLKYVSMSGCPVSSLRVENCTGCCALEILDCSFTGIATIDKKLFSAFPNMKLLNLSHTGITDISMLDNRFFKKHKNILKIDLTGCEIAKFPRRISVDNRSRFAGVSWKPENVSWRRYLPWNL